MPKIKKTKKPKTLSLDLITCEYLEELATAGDNASDNANTAIQESPGFREWLEKRKEKNVIFD